MPTKEVASIADRIHGTKPYQQRARAALPILVRQVEHGIPRVTYQDLARELGMPNPRNLDYVLGSIGQSLVALGKRWGHKIPPIECIVVNKGSGIPGKGVRPFLTAKPWAAFTGRQRHQLVDKQIEQVMVFPKWRKVLQALRLPLPPDDLGPVLSGARTFKGGGESAEHKRLKEWVAAHPAKLGLGKNIPKGTTEWDLPSGDAVDVMFRLGREWVGVEVKSSKSVEGDLTRGLFQCVKYQATLEAEGVVEGDKRKVRTILALGGKLPARLVGIKNLLGLTVIENLE